MDKNKWFQGKRFRRTRCENIDELMRETNASEQTIQILKSSAPIFSYTRINDDSFTFILDTGEKVMTHNFKLGEETDMERRDGTKVKVTFVLENDNCLIQTIKQPDGKVAYFRREFSENETKMIITMEGSDKQAVIYYEVLD